MTNYSISSYVNRDVSQMYRKAYIKRRDITTGLYESDWVEVSQYVKKWGKISNAVDDVRLNAFKQSGITLNCVNDEGKFKFIRAVDCWKMCLQIEPRWAKHPKRLKSLGYS